MKKYEYDEASGDFTFKKSNEQEKDRENQAYIESSYTPQNHNILISRNWLCAIILVICVVCGIFIGKIFISESEQIVGAHINGTPESDSFRNSSQINKEIAIQVDQNRVKRLISNICRHSSKGGNYEMLEFYFEDTIFPHPSGKKRFKGDIANETRNFVEYYPEYVISEPYNFVFLHDTFPLTLKCDVDVMWISKKSGYQKKASIHKIYYITSNYKVSGFVDDEFYRTTLSY